jgi:hypothetical protein
MANKYTSHDVRYFLTKRLGKKIPPATFKRWKRILGVKPEPIGKEWLYTQDDIEALSTLGNWLKCSSATIDGFCRKHNFIRQDKQHG